MVAIIGILAGIVAIKFSGAQKKAKENADYANASNIATAAYMAESEGKEGNDAYNIENGSIIYSVDGNKNAFKVVRLRGLMLLSALLFFIWKIGQ